MIATALDDETADHPMKDGVRRRKPSVHVLQEVGHGQRRAGIVEFHDEIAGCGLELDLRKICGEQSRGVSA